MSTIKKTAEQKITHTTERDLADLRALTNTEADRRLRELLEKGSQSSTGLEDIESSVRRLRAL
jgi:hypothetical protein